MISPNVPWLKKGIWWMNIIDGLMTPNSCGEAPVDGKVGEQNYKFILRLWGEYNITL